MWVRVQFGDGTGKVLDTLSRQVPTPTDAMDTFDYLVSELDAVVFDGDEE